MVKRREGLVAPNNPILYQVAEMVPVGTIQSANVQKIIGNLLHIAYGEKGDPSKPVLMGLAAPQAGISKRIIVVDTTADGYGHGSNLEVFINPRIVKHSKKTNEWYEGCYSTDRVCGIVNRFISIGVSAYTKEGKRIQREYEGYVARIFQHEIDHLNGIEFISHITDDAKLHWVEDDEFPLYRDKEAWRTWPRKCSRKQWEKIKGII